MSSWVALLAGGSGTRFWPLSTADTPKQLLPLTGWLPLLRETFERVRDVVPADRILVLAGRPVAQRTRSLLPEIPDDNFLIEPIPKSTGPTLAWATRTALARDAEATVLSLHADWFVGDAVEFRRVCTRAIDAARSGRRLVTVGIRPSRPETGYGYIVPGEGIEDGVREVVRFVEKPGEAEARDLVASGALWNSGLFAWRADVFLEETRRLAPEIAPHLGLLEEGLMDQYFDRVERIAVDVSHFERSRRVAVLPADFGWDDVGTWAALARVTKTDGSGNVTRGPAFVRDAARCVAWAEDGAVVLDGVSDLVVVRARGVTLVTTTERAADLKKLLDELPPSIRELPERPS